MASQAPTRYCKSCIQLMTPDGLRQAQKPEGFSFGTLEEFKARSFLKCQFCRRLRKQVDCDYLGPLRLVFTAGLNESERREGDQARYYLHSGVGKWGIKPFDSLNLFELPEWSGSRYHVTSIFAVASTDNPAASFVTRRPPETDFSSDGTYSVAKSWIRECRSTSGTEHRDCPAPDIPQLPKRVIDVGQDPRGDFIRVHESSQGEKAQYACLSYCWGGPQAVMTTKATLEKLKQGVALNMLGKTIQDAVEVTRGIELRYLWIDAICIIQDDDDDRSGEIMMMGSIYRNAIITIAASMARSASEGFLFQPSLSPVVDSMHYSFSFALPDDTEGTVHLYPKEVGGPSTSEEMERNPLDDRAWALQEILLSPRVLIFTRHELVWLCRNKGYRQAQKRYTTYTPSIKDQFLLHSKDESVSWRFDHPEQQWMSLVEEYTRRKISDPEDRLNAIAGIAAAFVENAANPDSIKYWFGLWSTIHLEDNILVRQLGWHCDHATLKTSTRSSRAPTWSWASVDDPVSFPIWNVNTNIRQMLGFKLNPTQLDSWTENGSEDVNNYSLRLNAKIQPLAQLRAQMTETGTVWMDTAEGSPIDGAAYYCMLWAVESSETLTGGTELAILLLRETTGAHAFERVGFAMFQEPSYHLDTKKQYEWSESVVVLV